MIYSAALELANKYAELILPGCKRLEIVGSVKRADQTQVHDIEFLLIPDESRGKLEFGKKIPPIRFFQVMDDLCAKNMLRFVSGKSKQRRYEILEVPVTQTLYMNPFYLELYIVTPDTWGIQNVIRTGPSAFSHAFVAHRSLTIYDEKTRAYYKGLLPDDLTYMVGETTICSGETPLSLREERDALALIGHGWVEPKDRMRILQRVSVDMEA